MMRGEDISHKSAKALSVNFEVCVALASLSLAFARPVLVFDSLITPNTSAG